MNSWIFQSKPEEFRLAAFLSGSPDRVLWRVSRSASKMRVGDEVYLWQAIGKGPPSMSGIFGLGHIVEEPTEREDDGPSRRFWIYPLHATDKILRAMIKIETCATNPIIKRERFERDAELQSSRIMRVAQGTNFLLSQNQASCIREISLRARTSAETTRVNTTALV